MVIADAIEQACQTLKQNNANDNFRNWIVDIAIPAAYQHLVFIPRKYKLSKTRYIAKPIKIRISRPN